MNTKKGYIVLVSRHEMLKNKTTQFKVFVNAESKEEARGLVRLRFSEEYLPDWFKNSYKGAVGYFTGEIYEEDMDKTEKQIKERAWKKEQKRKAERKGGRLV